MDLVRSWWCLLGIGFCLLSLSRCSEDEAKDQFIQRTGVIVSKDGAARLLSALWTVVVVLDIPSKPEVTPLLDQYDNVVFKVRSIFPANFSGYNVWNARMKIIQQNLAVSPTRTPRRVKRGAIDFIGYLGRELFGLATVQDVSSIRDLVQELQFSVDRVNYNNDYMLTILNATKDTLQALSHNMDLLDARTRELSALVNSINVMLHDHILAIQNLQLQDYVDQILTLLELVSSSYADAILSYKVKLSHLDHGRLSREILPENELNHVLDRLRQKGHQSLAINWYYKHLNVDLMWETDRQLAYQVVIPVVTHELCFSYSMLYVPVPISANLTRVVKGAKNIILSTESNTAFAPQPQSCLGADPKVCYPALQAVTRACESSLLQGRGIADCEFVIAKKPHMASMAYRSMKYPFTIVIVPFASSSYLVRCPGIGSKRVYLHNISVVTLRDGCGLESDDWRVAGVKLGTTRINISGPVIESFSLHDFQWPPSLPGKIMEELELHDLVTVPFADIRTLSNGYNKAVPGVGVSLGSVSMIVILAIGISIYVFKHMASFKAWFASKTSKVIKDLPEEHLELLASGSTCNVNKEVSLDIPNRTVSKLVNPK